MLKKGAGYCYGVMLKNAKFVKFYNSINQTMCLLT